MLTKTDLTSIGKVVDNKLQPIKKDLRKIKKDLDVSIKLTDKLQVSLENRVKTIEKNLKIPTPDFI